MKKRANKFTIRFYSFVILLLIMSTSLESKGDNFVDNNSQEHPPTDSTAIPIDTVNNGTAIEHNTNISLLQNPYASQWRFKVNTLYMLALVPNIEVEYAWNKHYSINLEAEYTRWIVPVMLNLKRGLGVWSVSPEFRYWFAADIPFTEHYVGIYGHGGQYGFKTDHSSKGVQGDFIGAGLTYGYVFDISKYFDAQNSFYFDVGIGIGYVYSPYSKFAEQDGCSCETSSGNRNYWGLTKAKASFVVRLSNTHKN